MLSFRQLTWKCFRAVNPKFHRDLTFTILHWSTAWRSWCLPVSQHLPQNNFDSTWSRRCWSVVKPGLGPNNGAVWLNLRRAINSSSFDVKSKKKKEKVDINFFFLYKGVFFVIAWKYTISSYFFKLFTAFLGGSLPRTTTLSVRRNPVLMEPVIKRWYQNDVFVAYLHEHLCLFF